MNGRIIRIEKDKIVKNKYMIQVNELRIGNKVNVIAIDDWVTITSVDQIGLIEFTTNYDEMSEPVEDSVSAVEGIPLAPEILEKCGFIKINGIHGEFFKSLYSVRKDKTLDSIEYDFFIHGTSGFTRLSSIAFLHQLQNLYFALTGTELSVTATKLPNKYNS